MSFTQGLHRSLQSNPDGIAVVDGDHELTFRELGDRVARLAGGLRGLGVAQGDRISILAGNRAEYVEFALVCSWLAAVATPLNNRWSPDEMAFQIEESETAVVLVDRPRLASALALRERCESLKTVVLLGGDEGPDAPDVVDYEELIAASEPVADSRHDGTGLGMLMYTGGTTGRPKGVMLSEQQVLVSCWGSGMSSGLLNLPERTLYVSPLFHLAALASMVHTLTLGSTHVFMREFDVDRLVATIRDKGVTATTMVPTMIKWMLDRAEETDADLSSLQTLRYGAAPMPETLVRRLRDALPTVKLRQAYGMTELGPVATILRDEDHHDAEHPERLRSVGRAAAHAEIRLVDAADHDVPAGTVGEIVVSGPHVMLGYWRNEEITEQTLRGGWMHTGDAGYVDEHGYLYLVDRLKDMIVSGGENVYSVEVEKAIHEHESVSTCAVIGVPDEDWGERVHAVVVLKPGAELTTTQLRDFVGERIARYKAPRTADFVSELPLSPVGKILKRELRERYRS